MVPSRGGSTTLQPAAAASLRMASLRGVSANLRVTFFSLSEAGHCPSWVTFADAVAGTSIIAAARATAPHLIPEPIIVILLAAPTAPAATAEQWTNP